MMKLAMLLSIMKDRASGIRTARAPGVAPPDGLSRSPRFRSRNGFFINHNRDIRREYPPVPESLLDLIELGGTAGWLGHWWKSRKDAKTVRA
jgi:hypothetical protein